MQSFLSASRVSKCSISLKFLVYDHSFMFLKYLDLYLNVVQGPEIKALYRELPDHCKANGDQMALSASSMIRSHSVSGDLHGTHPDPIAADILRKEPEQETFVQLKIRPNGMLSCILSSFSLLSESKLLFLFPVNCLPHVHQSLHLIFCWKVLIVPVFWCFSAKEFDM